MTPSGPPEGVALSVSAVCVPPFALPAQSSGGVRGDLGVARTPHGVPVSAGNYLRTMRSPTWLRRVLRAGDHWLLLWMAAWVSLAKWGGPVASGLAMATPFVVGIVVMALVSFLTPPARPLRETSALINRLAMFGRGVWAATLFACAGVFGAWVAIDLESVQTSTPEVLRLSRESVSTVVIAAAIVVGLLSMMGVAWDLNRAKDTRREAIWRLTARLLKCTQTRRFKEPLDEWLDWFTSSWRPWLIAFLAPFIGAAIWNTVLPFGDESFRLW